MTEEKAEEEREKIKTKSPKCAGMHVGSSRKVNQRDMGWMANSVVDLGRDLSVLNDVISLFFLLHCAACLFDPNFYF